jgi:hypothetical protein
MALTIAMGGVASAQGLPSAPIDSGTLVRLHFVTKQEPMRGRLLETFTPSSLQLTFCRFATNPCASLADPHARTIPATDVERIEVARGNHLLRGAVIGTLVGAAVAGVFIAVANGVCDTSDCEATGKTFALTTIGLSLGIGLLFGSQSLTWKPAP